MKHKARKRFGQNFLQDESVITRMLSALKPAYDDQVIEVGPGLAALTLPLLEQLDSLTVVEIDRDLIARLRERKLDKLFIHEGDVLDINWHNLADGRSLRIVGNLPYNIGTQLLLELSAHHPVIRDVHVMLQKEVVNRLHADAGTRAYGRLSVLMQSVFTITPLFTVPPEAFQPVPKVESAVVRLKTRPDALPVDSLIALQTVTRLAFANKRKTLRNNFKGHLDAQQLHALDINPQARAETLSLSDFNRLASRLTTQTDSQ
ncbi:MAG: 16S rRNA (adenine(1518)-N(6)/adenine(1519)-N(6))-dimethyltransferase RsmA [Granulosicoccus sp.]